MHEVIAQLAALILAANAYAATLEQQATPSTSTVRAYIERRAAEETLPVSLFSRIAECESGYIFDAVGKNWRVGDDGERYVWSRDVGPTQINDYYHQKAARDLGLSIHEWTDNIEYGIHLYKTKGTQPWSASRHCWWYNE